MFKRTKVSMAAVVAIGTLVGGAALAQDAQRIEITGSSIKRIAAEGALPVITLTKQDIERTGATSARELIQGLPSMQGFTAASNSVNGGGGGTTTASLRNLGEQYTLVLLNGRRVAPFDTGSTVNLEQLPLASIERVEVLLDGASTLYGADAIAGVVNFITKKNSTDGSVDVKISMPQHKGGDEILASVSKGFGNLDTDGFNILASLSYEKQKKILATDREFSKTGVIPFDYNGRPLIFTEDSGNSNPPNVQLYSPTAFLANYNPILATTGNCGSDPASFARGTACRFDFASTVEAQPESERKNLFLSGQVKLGKDFTGFAEALISDSSVTAKFAAPAQPLGLSLTSPLYTKYVLPTLAGLGINPADVDSAAYSMRLVDAGQRGNEFNTRANHLVLGIEGSAFSFDGTVSYTHSENKRSSTYTGGYTSLNKMNQLIEDGLFDPFNQGSAASVAALAPAVLVGEESNQKSTLDIASLRASRPVFTAPGGSAYLGFGADFIRQSYADNPSKISQGANPLQPNYSDFPVGSSQGSLPFDTSRDTTGIYAELMVPVMKSMELTGAIRYDSYDAAQNSRAFDALGNPAADTQQGNSASKTTYKLALRYQPVSSVLLRASYGTGFRAPTLQDIADPLKEFGVTDSQACPVKQGDPLFVGCIPGRDQWKLQTGGNPFTGDAGLKPESSEQWNVGMRFEPSSALSVGVDLWSVKVDDVITVVPQSTAFDEFERYRGLFSLTTDAPTGKQVLTFSQVPINGAAAKSTGVDLDLTTRATTGIGKFTGTLGATYLIDSWFDYGFGGGKESSLNKVGSDDKVAFRTLLKLQATLETGAFSNTFNVSWKPGYTDQAYPAGNIYIYDRLPDGSRGAPTNLEDHEIGSYTLWDWQGKWDVSKVFSVTAGIKNLFDKEPPLSLKTVGGNMRGFDPRYADGVGRTFSLAGSYKF